MTLLSVEQLFVDRGEQPIVRALSLSVVAGEIVRIDGPSGSGKTTLLRAIAQLIPLAGGQIRLNGQGPEQLGYPQWRARVVYAPQRPVMFEGTTLDNLARAFRYRHVRGPFVEARAAELLSRLELSELHRGKRPARELSGGEQQRVQLIRSLLLNPAVLLLDEPTASLGGEHVALAEQLIRDFADEGGSALLVTHDEPQASRLAHRSVSLQ